MVKRKGLSYSLEVIISALIIISFTYGIFELPQGNDWDQYRSEIEAQDLTQTFYRSGIATDLVSRGETGSMQTAISTVSDTGREVSGSVTNIPIGEVEVGYHTVESDQFTADLEPVQSGDECYGDLEDEIDTEETILRTQNLGVGGDNYGVRLYLADTGSQFDDNVNYNSLWVDNGTACQFASDEGPFYLEDIFNWGDSSNANPEDHFQIKEIDGASDELTIYQATQPVRIHKQMSQPVNSLQPEVEIDAVDIENEDMVHDVMVFRKTSSLDDIAASRADVENYMADHPVVMMMDLSQSDFQDSSFLQDSGLHWIDNGFGGGYSGGSTEVQFTDSDRSRNVETFFEGMSGEQSNVQLPPAGPIVSNHSNTLTEESPLLEGADSLGTGTWGDVVDSMSSTSASGDPQPNCGDRYQGTADLAGAGYDFINTEIVGSASTCPTNSWAVNIETPDSTPPGRGPFLHGQDTVIDSREYTILTNSDVSGCDLGECVEFQFSGNSNVEVANYRQSFQGFDGEELVLTGRKSSYTEDELKLLSSLIFSVYDSQVTFNGERDTGSISTDIISSVDETTYMPYHLRLRWSE
jgi:hypothetical protein